MKTKNKVDLRRRAKIAEPAEFSKRKPMSKVKDKKTLIADSYTITIRANIAVTIIPIVFYYHNRLVRYLD